MQVQKAIERLGFKANEAKVYLAALSLGGSTVTEIAAKLRLPRTSVQVILEKLHDQGLVGFYTRKRYKYWAAEKPDHLIQQLQQREQEMRSILPQLEKMRRHRQERVRVRTLEGTGEIRQIYDDMLETKEPIAGIIPWDQWLDLLGRGFMEDFIERRTQRYLRMRLLAPRTKISEELKSRDSKELRETRFLPEDIPVSSTVLLYGTKVAIVSLNKKLPSAVIIEDPEVRETNSALFEEIWERSTASSDNAMESGALFRFLVDTSPLPILITNDKSEIQYVNEAWQQEFGYTFSDVYGKNPRLLQSGKTPKAVYTRLWQALEAGKPFATDEFVDKRKDGSLRKLHSTIFPLQHRGVQYFVQTVYDITERKRGEEFRERFLRSASEDMRSPLRSMRDLIKKLQGDEITTGLAAKLDELDDIAKQLFISSRSIREQ